MARQAPRSTALATQDFADASRSQAARPHLLLLLGLFAASGCAALIYEIVWFQLLQLAIGSSAVSLGVLLGTYMGGMCLGSLALPKCISKARNPLRVYAALEVGIGALAILVLFAVPYLDQIYAAIATHGLQGISLRAALAAICLIPPTLLMGASLPALARWAESSPEGVSWLGFLYGSNIAGAVFGCLLAGFYLLRVYDMRVATFVGAAINFAVALISLWLAGRRPAKIDQLPHSEVAQRPSSWLVYVAIALSGMTALGAEVVWTRLLSVMIGATVYTFSIILAVFLIGLGIGSAIGSAVGRRRPRLALGLCQFLLAAAIFWSAYALSASLPYWPINPFLTSSAWFNFQIDMVRCLWAILPAAILWGASFPLALAAAARGQDPGHLTGRIYAANTIGAIAGAIGFSIVFIPWMGSRDSERLLIGISVAAALLALIPAIRLKGAIALAAATALSVFLIFRVEDVPWLAVAYGRRMLTTTGTGSPLYRGEGRDASVVVSRTEAGAIYFHVSGKVEASTEPFDMRLQRMLGHLPALIHPNPRSALIVGFGAGVTAGTFVVHPEIEKIRICEIEKLIPAASTRYFNAENHNVLNDPRTRVIYDDARHYVLTTDDNFDIITSDPIHPWVKGTATLYSKEYFEICKRHLNAGGVVTQWVPLYESDPETIRMELATFFDVFPNGTIWANDINHEGYDVVLLGWNGDGKIDADQMQRRIDLNAPLAASLRQAAFGSAADLLATYAGRGRDLSSWLTGAHVNTDLDLRLQYLAGMGLNYNNADAIKQQISLYLRYPEDLFVGSPDLLQQIEVGIRPR